MRTKGLALLLCICILLCACGKQEEQASRYIGYNLSGEAAGGAPLEHANAYRLSVKTSGETTALSIKFISGSRMSGSATQSNAANVPPYTAWMLANPARLMLRVTGLAYWDYERDIPSPAGLVLGSFRYVIEDEENQDAAETYICFQLSGDCAYKVEESDGSLTLTLIAKTKVENKVEDAAKSWYLVGDAFRDYCAGRLQNKDAFTPTYDQGFSRIMLVSAPYPSEIEAELAKKQLLEREPLAVPSEWSVLESQSGAMPTYDENARYAVAYEENIQRREGEIQRAEVFLADGLYLGSAPRRLGGGALYSKRISKGTGVDIYSFEQLYIKDAQGVDKCLLNYEFTAVEQAVFSPDARRLAVLERSAERTNLYVVDVEMREVTAELTQAGFGDMVSALCWDSVGSVLFAVSGSGEMQIHAYDFSVPDESKRHTVVDKNGANDGYIGYCGGEVYFVESDMDKDTIYRIKPEGGVRKAFYSGSAFALSPNNAYMAISSSSGSNSLLLFDMKTGITKVIPSEFAVYEFVWSQDGSRVYYFENRLSGGLGEESEQVAVETQQDAYPYTLWSYEIESGEIRAICDLPGVTLSTSHDADRLYFIYSDEDTAGEKIRATYLIEAGKALEEVEEQEQNIPAA